ncbi:MAG: T9SS type A sorting domain-containing protein [candidate division WOR-3 bacterium]|nr:T9SS type A sorting domain-containing protein [candidate division WOR-3 bacterium]
MSLRWLAVLLLLFGAAVALGRDLSFQEHAAVQESLSRVHPRMRASWLRERGLDDSYYTTFQRPESTGLSCIGRWPWGPSWELAGRDTFLYLGSGSGVRILSIADSVHPRMLGQINARGLVSQVVVQDSLLFVACGSWGAQIYSVSDPARPRELGSMDAVIGDVCVKDTFCYAVGGDSFRIYNVADPYTPRQLGAEYDTRSLILLEGSHAFLASDAGMNVYDVSNPSSPQLVNSRGGSYATLFIRDTLLFCSDVQPSYFAVLDVSDPLDIRQVGNLSGYGGHGLYADDDFAYLSCAYDHQGIFVIDIANPANPQLRDSLNPEGTDNWDPYVPVPLSYGYLASDYGGLVTVDLHNVNSISEAWSGYKADRSEDIHVDGQLAYVADMRSGLQILDIADPANPVSLGLFDTIGSKATRTATARDSFAFIGMDGITGRRFLRVLNVLDPSNPTLVAQESCYNWPQDYVLRDSLLYVVEAYMFQIFNVARPREPARVGSCNTQEQAYGLCIVNSLAYVANYPFAIIDVGQPSSPIIISTISRGAWNGTVRDTFLFLSSGGVLVYSVADPSRPRLLDSVSVGPNTYWVEAVGTLLYTGNRDGVRVVDAADIHDMRVRGFCPAPYTVNRLTYKSPYVYAACWEAGVSIYESTQVAVSEPMKGGGEHTELSVRPNPVTTNAVLSVFGESPGTVTVRDIAGRVVRCATKRRASGEVVLNMAAKPPGVYFVESKAGAISVRVKFVKQ